MATKIFTLAFGSGPGGQQRAKLKRWELLEGGLRWVWSVYYQGYEFEFNYDTGCQASPKTPLGDLLRAMGIPPFRTEAEAQAFDLDTLLGKEVFVEIDVTEKTGFRPGIVRLWGTIPR